VPEKPVEEGGHIPHELTVEEIQVVVKEYATAAKNAIAAGFDGVEVHGANGYILDQFFHDTCNKRTDEYGGSIENRARFGLEITKAIIEAVGDSKKVAVRLSPWAFDQMESSGDPVPQFLHIISELKKLDLAYLHLVESRVSGTPDTAVYKTLTRRNVPFVELWGSEIPIILAGGFTPDSARKALDEIYEGDNVCLAFGRYFISTPDLPFRIREGLPLNPYDRPTFYTKMSPKGYVDYPFSPEYEASTNAQHDTQRAIRAAA
jgi:NADPH2 dehydrogenase